MPRLPSPRVSVPAGSIAIAGGMSAVYPAASPGGWRLIGRTTTRMWDPGREPPALLAPGRRVRFIAQHGGSAGSAARPAEEASAARAAHGAAPAPGQPLSRGRQAGSAGDRSGPWQTRIRSSRRASRWCGGCREHGRGQPAGGQPATRRRHRADPRPGRVPLQRAGCTLAVTGAPADITLRTGEGGQASQRPIRLPRSPSPTAAWSASARPTAGLRSYLAVSGGITTPAELGSRSADLHSGVGGPLRAGRSCRSASRRQATANGKDRVPDTGTGVGLVPGAGHKLQRSGRFPARGAITRLRIVPGPRADWFAPSARWPRCAARRTRSRGAATGPACAWTARPWPGPRDAELPSEGVVTGALQVPHDGKPILLLSRPPDGRRLPGDRRAHQPPTSRWPPSSAQATQIDLHDHVRECAANTSF